MKSNPQIVDHDLIDDIMVRGDVCINMHFIPSSRTCAVIKTTNATTLI
jgi:hypothetical protein